MEELLRKLLNHLDQVGVDHEELYDTECRQHLSNAVVDGFVRGQSEYILADDFGLHKAEANREVRKALTAYIADAKTKAAELGIVDFHKRLDAFQNPNVESDEEGSFYDDFFGHSAPELFDSEGNALSQA